MELMKKGIIGIEIELKSLAGKFKVSQELADGDREGAVRGFEGWDGGGDGDCEGCKGEGEGDRGKEELTSWSGFEMAHLLLLGCRRYNQCE